MLQSHLRIKTIKEDPADADSINARLLTRAGFISRQMAGVFTYMPLGLRVLKKIQDIIREEMNALGAQEILMPTLSQRSTWKKTERDTMDIMFHMKGSGDADFVLNPTHEEIITPIMKQHIHSYKDLPAALYQIQDKYRNEPRAKSGILRGREFNMKDLYSFHATEEDLDRFYQNAVQAYLKIYRRLRLGDRTIFTYATGGDFSTYSHEFQTICDSGEDTIYINQASGVALNKELLDKKESIPEFAGKELNEKKAIEVGNIFKLGTRFSEAFDLSFTDEEGKKHPVIMASYGIGPSRLMGTLVEVYHDEKGMRWPDSVAPFQAHLLEFDLNNASVGLRAKSLYEVLVQAGVELLYDDRKDVSPGAKLAEADLIGIPMRLVISRKTGNKVEVKRRDHDSPHLMGVDDLIQQLAK